MERLANGETKRRMNWFDWLLIVSSLLLVIGGFLGVRYLLYGTESSDGVAVYTVLISGMEDAPYLLGRDSVFSIGDTVRSQNGTAMLGTVEEITTRAHRVPLLEDGSILFGELDGHTDYYVTVRVNAKKREGDGIRAQDIRIAAGMRVGLRVGDFLVRDGEIVSVQWEAEDE